MLRITVVTSRRLSVTCLQWGHRLVEWRRRSPHPEQYLFPLFFIFLCGARNAYGLIITPHGPSPALIVATTQLLDRSTGARFRVEQAVARITNKLALAKNKSRRLFSCLVRFIRSAPGIAADPYDLATKLTLTCIVTCPLPEEKDPPGLCRPATATRHF